MSLISLTLGPHHREYATSLHNLAEMFKNLGDYAQAVPLLQEACEIYRLTLGPQHPNYATSLSWLALMFQKRGNYPQAEQLMQEAREIRRLTLGLQHPDYADSLWGLAMLYAATSRVEDAVGLLQQDAMIDDRMTGQIFSIGAESQRTAYLKSIRSHQDEYLSLLCQSTDAAAARHTALELILRRKAIGAEAHAAQRDAVRGGKYPALEPKLRDIALLRMQVAQKTLAGPGPEGFSTHQQLLDKWNARKDKLEVELVWQIPEMNLEKKLQAVDQQAVAEALSVGAILVEFVRFDDCDFKAVRVELKWKPARYLAFTLPAGEPDNVQMIDLGEAVPIERMIDAFREAVISEMPEEAERIGNDLRAAVFDPVVQALHGRRRLLIAPDGELERLPFEILPTGDGRQLIDEYQISYLSAGRDVLRFGAAVSG